MRVFFTSLYALICVVWLALLVAFPSGTANEPTLSELEQELINQVSSFYERDYEIDAVVYARSNCALAKEKSQNNEPLQSHTSDSTIVDRANTLAKRYSMRSYQQCMALDSGELSKFRI